MVELSSKARVLTSNTRFSNHELSQKRKTQLWILKNGSSGTAMFSFVPITLTEEEAWRIILYIRTFAKLRD
jgi:hypothetical protein